MNGVAQIEKEPAINQTGYRVLLLLKLLMQEAVSRDEIICAIKKDPFIKDISMDTVRLDLNTLKSLGFQIEITCKNNIRKYHLKFSPLKIDLTRSEIKAINQIKRAAIELWDWRYIIALYKTLEKISKFVSDKDFSEELLNFHYFMNIDFELLKDLEHLALKKSQAIIIYNSPKEGIIPIRMRVYDIKHNKTSNKLYLWGKFEGYDYISYLRIDKIKSVKQVEIVPTIDIVDMKFEYFKVDSKSDFELEDGEEIVELTENYMKIKSPYLNDFQFCQRILIAGESVIEIPERIKEKILEELLKIKRMYE